MTPDGRAYAYTYQQDLSGLYGCFESLDGLAKAPEEKPVVMG